MYIELNAKGGDHHRLCEELKRVGFRKTEKGYEKLGSAEHGTTTVQVLAPQNSVEIYFGSMGLPQCVSRDNMTPDALAALDLALQYVMCPEVKDHTGKVIDAKGLLDR
ncbi:MAG: hypothetical protein KKD17_05460 [Nanoarchaeota archaeon]|nr:hypothetical protein [Nanoarchaeota archaeon]